VYPRSWIAVKTVSSSWERRAALREIKAMCVKPRTAKVLATETPMPGPEPRT
jgi:hypothetical protein